MVGGWNFQNYLHSIDESDKRHSEQDIDCFLEAAGSRVSDIEIGGG